MKSILLSIIFIGILSMSVKSQVYVSTTPMNKVAILEEFTGVRCPNCPAGHTLLASLISSHPGTLFGIGCHPTNSSYTTPYNASDPDFRNAYLDAFYSTPFCGTSRYMPSAFINRREWSAGEKISGTSLWSSSATTIIAESSPLNVGLYAVYNTTTGLLDVTVEVYFTSTVTDNVYLYVALAENGLVAEQSNGGTSYVHYHVFREALATEQWGEPITGTTTTGSLFTQTYQFNNITDGYAMNNCEVTAFVRNGTDEEIISGNQVPVVVITDIAEVAKEPVLSIYPNPVSETSVAGIVWNSTENVKVSVFDIEGRLINTSEVMLQNGYNVIPLQTLTQTDLHSGNYILNISGSKDSGKIPFFVP
ncbi:MAG: Omp28-related outer membrane protein [Bacteroidales bacterium]|nr:Omp28-related outer membrane protein [Bacteroidales bacterium]